MESMDNYDDLPYIDVEEALVRLGNRKPLLQKLLLSFIADPKCDEFLVALESRDLQASVHAAHTVKGIAANLSLPRLRGYMATQELLFKQAIDQGDNTVFAKVDVEDFKAIVANTLAEAEKAGAELS